MKKPSACKLQTQMCILIMKNNTSCVKPLFVSTLAPGASAVNSPSQLNVFENRVGNHLWTSSCASQTLTGSKGVRILEQSCKQVWNSLTHVFYLSMSSFPWETYFKERKSVELPLGYSVSFRFQLKDANSMRFCNSFVLALPWTHFGLLNLAHFQFMRIFELNCPQPTGCWIEIWISVTGRGIHWIFTEIKQYAQ